MTQVEQAPAKVLTRVRLHYARCEALRYVSHLDMQLVWERTLRRASMPMAFSQGFSPKPRLHLACALPLGFLSTCEITDFWLEDVGDVPLEDLVTRIQAAAPPGLEIQRSELISLQEPALQTQVKSAVYNALPLDPTDRTALTQIVEALMQSETLPRERRNKPYDLRLLIEALEVGPGDDQHPLLLMRLASREGATGRPEEVLSALGLDPTAFRVERTALILE